MAILINIHDAILGCELPYSMVHDLEAKGLGRWIGGHDRWDWDKSEVRRLSNNDAEQIYNDMKRIAKMGMLEDSLDECMAATRRLMYERSISYEEARKIVADENIARNQPNNAETALAGVTKFVEDCRMYCRVEDSGSLTRAWVEIYNDLLPIQAKLRRLKVRIENERKLRNDNV